MPDDRLKSTVDLKVESILREGLLTAYGISVVEITCPTCGGSPPPPDERDECDRADCPTDARR